MIKIGCLSDIHGYVYGIIDKVYRDIELLIIAGDLCPIDDVSLQKEWLKFNFTRVFNRKTFPDLQKILIVPGNHDYWIEKNYEYFSGELYKIFGLDTEILVDREYEYISLLTGETIRLYGNPRTSLSLYAFPHKSGNKDILDIPEGVDILITHEAPRIYELECVKQSQGLYGEKDEPGNLALARRVFEINPKYHIFGHIHYPCKEIIDGITFMNVSQQLRENYNPELYTIDYEG